MQRALIYGTGLIFNEHIVLVKYHEVAGKYKIIGVTSDDTFYKTLYGYPFLNKSEISKDDFDIVIVMAMEKKMEQIEREINNRYPKDTDVIVPYKVLKLHNFDVDAYLRIKNNPPSIMSSNCWGGVIYHTLGMRFSSPLINMFVHHDEFLKLVNNLEYYMSQNISLVEEAYNEDLDIHYPVAMCGDIKLFFNHYRSFDEANTCWERRKKRINWSNIFVMMYDENTEIIEEFSKLQHKKKICFTPYSDNREGICQIKFRNEENVKGLHFWRVVMDIAMGRYAYLDIFKLLDTGQIVKTIED